MPVTHPSSTFEEVVLTQAAIRVTQILRDWFKKKDKATTVEASTALDPDRGATRAEVVENLYQEFLSSHSAIFTYSSRYNKRREDRVFHVDQLTDGQKLNLKKIISDFAEEAYAQDGTRKINTLDAAAESLHKFYETLKEANRTGHVPLRYMRFPASCMMVKLGKSEKWKDLIGTKGIDFTRGEKVANGDGLWERFKAALNGDLDTNRFSEFKSSPFLDHYQSHVEIEGCRFPCLQFGWGRTHLLTDNGYTVDLTKELALSLAQKIKSGVRADKLLIDYQPPEEVENDPSTKHISALIDNNFRPPVHTERQEKNAAKARESLTQLKSKLAELKDAERVDGRYVTPAKALLVCMDVDLLTGLSIKDKVKADGTVIDKSSEVARLGAFIHAHARHGNNFVGVRPEMPADLGGMSDFLSLFPKKAKSMPELLAGIDAALDKLKQLAKYESKDDIIELIDAARPHIKALAPRVMKAVDEHFIIKESGKRIKTAAELFQDAHGEDEKKMHSKVCFNMTVGGIAAGKSNAEAIVEEECGKGNFVIAGLDHVRSMFDRQAINLSTDNHNYDYKNMEQAGKLVRAIVLERARAKGYHVLLDGSGVPYEGRYSTILKAFKDCEHGYKTNVLAFDRALYANNPAYRNELQSSQKAPKDALLQQGIRFGRELRAVPIPIIVTNYASIPDALLQASQDENVDRFWLIDTNPNKRPSKVKGAAAESDMSPYIMSFTTEVTAEQLDAIERLKGSELRSAIEAMQNKTDEAGKNKKIRKALNHPVYSPDKTDPEKWDMKVVNKMSNGLYRIEVITDVSRYLSTLEKGLLNREANGPEELFKLTKLMGFDVEGHFQHDKCAIKVQPEGYVGHDDWPIIPHATQSSLAARGVNCLAMDGEGNMKPIPSRSQTGVAA